MNAHVVAVVADTVTDTKRLDDTFVFRAPEPDRRGRPYGWLLRDRNDPFWFLLVVAPRSDKDDGPNNRIVYQAKLNTDAIGSNLPEIIPAKFPRSILLMDAETWPLFEKVCEERRYEVQLCRVAGTLATGNNPYSG